MYIPKPVHDAQSVRSRDDLSPALLRSLQKRVSEAQYLNVENTDRYRPIMRYFYENHMAHQYTLSVEAVHDHILRNVISSYDLEQCELDLQQLTEWGNLTAEQDRSRARTVEEFMRRQLQYSITPYGIAFERLLVELETNKGTGGSLDVGLLEMLYHQLEELSELLDVEDVSKQHLQRVHRLWAGTSGAYENFNKIGRHASDYLAAIDRNKQKDDLADIDAFLAYKDILLEYLTSYTTSLLDYGDRIRALLDGWNQGERHATLIEGLSIYSSRYLPAGDGRLLTLEETYPRYHKEWERLFQWFQRRGGLETLRRRTNATIAQVARQSQRLVDRHSGISRKRELEQLAIAFSQCSTTADANRLAGVTLGCMTPRHICGSADVFLMADRGSVWRQPSQETPLQAIRRGGNTKRSRSAPVAADDGRQQEALRYELERRRREAQAWDQLFADGEINLGKLCLEDPGWRSELLTILARCLASPDWRAVASDGSQIELILPETNKTGTLQAPDGTLALPQFILRRDTDKFGRVGDNERVKAGNLV